MFAASSIAPMRGKAALLGALGAVGLWAGIGASAQAYDVVCRDGTISHAGGRQGACSHHGGVAGGGTTTPPVIAPPAPPVDQLPPVLTAGLYVGPTVVATGSAVTPPAISLRDDVAWPVSSVGYPLFVDWGDGQIETVPYTGIVTTSVGADFSLPQHVYAAPGVFAAAVSIADPAGHATTSPLLTITVAPTVTATDGYPRVVGTPRVGRTLTCVPGGWGDPAARIQYAWLRSGRVVASRVGTTYRVGRADQGRRIACRVTASNAISKATATSRARSVSRPLVRGPLRRGG